MVRPKRAAGLDKARPCNRVTWRQDHLELESSISN